MILAIDVGNSNIVLGAIDNGEISRIIHMHTDDEYTAAEYGVKAIVQPGGSIRDEDSIKKCDELGIAMLFTGERHFKH